MLNGSSDFLFWLTAGIGLVLLIWWQNGGLKALSIFGDKDGKKSPLLPVMKWVSEHFWGACGVAASIGFIISVFLTGDIGFGLIVAGMVALLFAGYALFTSAKIGWVSALVAAPILVAIGSFIASPNGQALQEWTNETVLGHQSPATQAANAAAAAEARRIATIMEPVRDPASGLLVYHEDFCDHMGRITVGYHPHTYGLQDVCRFKPKPGEFLCTSGETGVLFNNVLDDNGYLLYSEVSLRPGVSVGELTVWSEIGGCTPQRSI